MTESGRARTQTWLAFLASGVILTGIQGILPALPVIQREFALSDWQIGLVTGAYFLPSIFIAFPSGLIADRFGRRLVYVTSLIAFGLAGLGLVLSRSFPLILLLRVVQGAAYAAVHPLSITMVSDARAGRDLVAAQGRRVVTLMIADAALPVFGGLLVALSWYAPFMMQLAAIPLAIVGWFYLPMRTEAATQRSTALHLKELAQVSNNSMALSLQVAGFLRFLFKFVFLTYLPILLVNQRGLSPSLIGVILGVSALCGAIAASLIGQLMRFAAPSRAVALSLIGTSVALVVIAATDSVVIVILASLLFGASDSIYGVLQNALITQAIPPNLRATFVAVGGSTRNFGKFTAPLLFGSAILLVSLETAFVLVGAIAALTLVTVPPLVRLDKLIGDKVSLASH